MCFCLVPLYFSWVFIQDIEEIADLRTIKRLQLGVETTKISGLTFYPAFLIRRLVFLFICFYAHNDCNQIILICCKNLLMICYVSSIKPMTTKWGNILEIFGEIIFYFCTICLIMQTEFVEELEIKYNVGWILCYLIIFYIFVHLLS